MGPRGGPRWIGDRQGALSPASIGSLCGLNVALLAVIEIHWYLHFHEINGGRIFSSVVIELSFCLNGLKINVTYTKYKNLASLCCQLCALVSPRQWDKKPILEVPVLGSTKMPSVDGQVPSPAGKTAIHEVVMTLKG